MIKWPYLSQDLGIEIVKSKGAYLYTKEGFKILDAAGGAIVNNIGYGREEVGEVIKALVATSPNSHTPIFRRIGSKRIGCKNGNSISGQQR